MRAADQASRICCLTPPGQAAIATFCISGPHAWDAVRAYFRPLKTTLSLQIPQPGRFFLGRLGTDAADEVVLAIKQVEPGVVLELHTHGGRAVTDFVLELFRGYGLEVCTWDAFLHAMSTDSIRAEAACALALAQTGRTAAILLDQERGALTVALDAIKHAAKVGATADVIERLLALARYADIGRHLTTPWRVVIAGAPNVGKSSLVNALAGFQRSIVAPTPGTTRDVVTTQIAIDGWPVELVDTAGLRAAAPGIEAQGILQARQTLAAADLCVWVLDAAEAPVWPESVTPSPLSTAASGTPLLPLLVINKVDLEPAWDVSEAKGAVYVSARTGAGLAELCAAIARRLVPNVPGPGVAVPFTPQLAAAIESAARLAADGQIEAALIALQLHDVP
jgi:tRNA modification GTPase